MKSSPNGFVRLPDCTTWARKTKTFTAMSTFVTMKSVPATERERRAGTAALLAPVGTPAHSGHLIPTGAKTMQSVQIGRPQLEHVMAGSFEGGRADATGLGCSG